MAWYFYRKNAWLATQKKWLQRLLPFLRATGLFLIMFLLLQITFLLQRTEVERPVLITLLDNSESIRRFGDSNQIKGKIDRFTQDIRTKFGNKYDLAFYTIGSKFKDGQSALLNETESHHELAFKQLSEIYLNRNVGAVIFASDGNYNKGDNPTYAAEQLSLTPIFSIGIGDTIPKKDQMITNLYYNDVVFLNDVFPIQVDIEAYKIQNATALVTLSQNGKTIASKSITYGNDDFAYKQVPFEVTASKVGFQPYTITVEYLKGENSKVNNTRTCYIEVIDSRNSLVFTASSPHPDLAALRAVAETNENYETSFMTPQEIVTKKIKPDLVVWHGPNLPGDNEAFAYIKQQKIPVLFIIPGSLTNSTQSALDLFNLSNQRGQSDEIQGKFNNAFNVFDLSEESKNAIEYFPPLVAKFGVINPKGNFETLLFQKIGNTVKSEPLMYLNKQYNLSHGLIYGEGLWRWRMADYMKTKSHSHFNELFLKTFAYLLVKKEGMGLSVQFEKRFNKNERITVNANFYNASLEPITTPKITMTLIDDKGKKFVNQFNVLNNGYNLDLGSLAPGNYQWTASTEYQNKKYVKKGAFLVEDQSLERSVNAANHGILKQLAKQSNGKYYPFSAYEKALNDIEKRSDITTIEHATTQFWNLVDTWFLLLFIALCFFTEWFLKRYYGAY
jgi:hypothetical protein